ncbi:TlpA disulfide reductase family protein [Daejeonella sp.]|uniref:TlpA family protein disulfide reductase n=1 Tax=Daejeonella sp. TaxID=2805397 RepID=UPI0030BB712E
MKIYILVLLSIILSSPGVSAQQIPDVKLDDLQGKSFNTGLLNKADAKVTVLAFWATWCIPCINELSTVNDNLDDWKKKYQFDFYAVSEDDSRTINRVKPLVNGKNWDFTVLLDKNQDLKRKLNVMNVPYTMIIKGGKIIYKHSGFVIGDEEALLKVIKDNQ